MAPNYDKVFESPKFIQNCCNLKFNRLTDHISIPNLMVVELLHQTLQYDFSRLRLNLIIKIKTTNKKINIYINKWFITFFFLHALTLAFTSHSSEHAVCVIRNKIFYSYSQHKKLNMKFAIFFLFLLGSSLVWIGKLLFYWQRLLMVAGSVCNGSNGESVVELHKSHNHTN